MNRMLALAACLACASVPARAQAVTVQSLLGQGFTVVAAMASPAGPGLFLFKSPNLWACFVSETPDSPALTTRYCKPVQ